MTYLTVIVPIRTTEFLARTGVWQLTKVPSSTSMLESMSSRPILQFSIEPITSLPAPALGLGKSACPRPIAKGSTSFLRIAELHARQTTGASRNPDSRLRVSVCPSGQIYV